MAQQSVQARVMIEPAKLPITEGKTHKQNGTNKQKTTTGKYYKQKKQKEAPLNVAEFLAGAGKKKSETKTKQKHFPEKQSANKKKNGLAMMKMQAERDDRVVFLLIFSII